MSAPLGTEARATARLLLLHGDLAEVATGTRAGWHIDERDPTRDRRIIEFCFGIPPEQFLAGGQTRALVRRAMRDRLPEATLTCRERGLQSADWYLSLTAERAAMEHELSCLQGSPIARRCLDLARMQRLLEHWPSADAARPLDLTSWPQALTRGLSVGHFIRNFDPDADLPAFTTPAEHHHELQPR